MSPKKSTFNALSTIPDGAYLDFVYNGTNYRISKADFITALGATGVIEQDGDPAGVAVLDVDGTTFKIRNIEPKTGIAAAVSPQNGLELTAKIASGMTGEELYNEEVDGTLTFKSVFAGTGVTITDEGDYLNISISNFVIPNNTVIVNSMDDFPTPVAGVITLADDTYYQVSDRLTTTNRFVFGDGTVLGGINSRISRLEYTGTGIMFTGVDIDSALYDLSLNCPNGTLFSISATAPASGRFFAARFDVDNAKTLGTINNQLAFQLVQFGFENVSVDGFTFTGTNGILQAERFLANQNAGDFFDLGVATFSAVLIENCLATLAAGTSFLKGAAASANINVGGLGSITNGRFGGVGTPLDTISVDDARWQFALNDDIPDTRPDGLLSVQGNALLTTITVAGTPVLLNAVWVVESTSQMTGTTAGRLTYDGGKDAKLPITASVSLEPSTGTNISVSVVIAKNGAAIPASKRVGTASAGSPTSITVPWQENFESGDYVEIWVANEDTTADILASSAIFRVN